MKFSPIVIAAAMAVAGSSACAATSALDLSSGSAGFSGTPPAGGFSDSYTFTLPSATAFTASITAVAAGGQDVDFTSIALSGPSGLFSFTQVGVDPFEFWTLSTPTLAAGAYALTLVGANSAAIGSYAGNVALGPPVPEPQTYALLLAGLAAIGLRTRRRAR